MFSWIRKWWADRKLARQARKAPRWESGGYIGNPHPNHYRATNEPGDFVPLLPSQPFVVAPIYDSECPPPHDRTHDDGRCQVIPMAHDSGYSSNSDSGSSSCDSGGSSDSGCSGGGGD